jgi:hypothetical protein
VMVVNEGLGTLQNSVEPPAGQILPAGSQLEGARIRKTGCPANNALLISAYLLVTFNPTLVLKSKACSLDTCRR